jgi:hypothetical protein
VAPAVPVPSARDRQRDAASPDRGRRNSVAGDRPARLVDADAGREHRRIRCRAVPAEGRACLPSRTATRRRR